MSEPIRLQKLLSTAGVASRRSCEKLISEGRVSVNGEVVTVLGTKATNADDVRVDGNPIATEEKQLYLFHKPRNVITSLSDPQGRPTVADYIEDLPVRVFPVGRLDFDVTGLLLLTNDGELSQKLTHPSFEIPRTYIAEIEQDLSDHTKARLLEGIELPDGPAKPIELEAIIPNKQTKLLFGKIAPNRSLVRITVAEGRNHFVKNIFKAIDRPVIKLARVSFGQYRLDMLKLGDLKKVPIG